MGVPVVLHEMRPTTPTAVHKTGQFAELVCSNSFRGDKLDNAVGLLKEEMRRLGSLIMREGDRVRVPAGAALAVDREQFAEGVTRAICDHPRIRVDRAEVSEIPAAREGDVFIIATGPLTSAALSQDIARFVGREHLAFFDAISPIVLAETIDMGKVFRQSRWDRSLGPRSVDREGTGLAPRRPRGLSPQSSNEAPVLTEGHRSPSTEASVLIEGHRSPSKEASVLIEESAPIEELQRDGDYLNCPMSEAEYRSFHAAIVSAEKAEAHDFDNTRFFEGCLPIEVMAHRGVDTLRFGPMKPAGLTDPQTGRRPYAVVQLRQDNLAGDHWSLVGFQTQMKWGEQGRVLRMIPGLEQAEFVRFGMIHRNTYINGPTVLQPTWQTRARSDLFFAGQVSGVEGYVESAASGLIAGRNAARLALGQDAVAPPVTTAIGALAHYVSHADPAHYQPTNITFGIMPPLDVPPKHRQERATATSARALADLERWIGSLQQ